eukprot:5023065-Amphidinium_carterae.1
MHQLLAWIRYGLLFCMAPCAAVAKHTRMMLHGFHSRRLEPKDAHPSPASLLRQRLVDKMQAHGRFCLWPSIRI